MKTNPEALKDLYKALGGSESDVEECVTSVEVMNKISALLEGETGAVLNPNAIENITAVAPTGGGGSSDLFTLSADIMQTIPSSSVTISDLQEDGGMYSGMVEYASINNDVEAWMTDSSLDSTFYSNSNNYSSMEKLLVFMGDPVNLNFPAAALSYNEGKIYLFVVKEDNTPITVDVPETLIYKAKANLISLYPSGIIWVAK